VQQEKKRRNNAKKSAKHKPKIKTKKKAGEQIFFCLSRPKKSTNCRVSMLKKVKSNQSNKRKGEKGKKGGETESKSKKSMPFLRNYTLRIRDMY